MSDFIQIPVRHRSLDPKNREQVRAFIGQVEAKFDAAAKAWERGNNSGDALVLRGQEARCDRIRHEAEAMLAPLGIKCTYPGLYPAFSVRGYDEHATSAAVLAALRLPRNFLTAA